MNEALLNPALIEAIQKAAQSVGIPALAIEMDMKPSSLYNTLNPYADRNSVKLGLEAALYIMRRSGDATGLMLMAHELGYRITPLEAEPDKDSIEAECCDDFDALSTFSKMTRNKEFPPVKAKDIIHAADRAKKEIDQTVKLWLDTQEDIDG